MLEITKMNTRNLSLSSDLGHPPTTSSGVLMPQGYLQTLPKISTQIMGRILGEDISDTVRAITTLSKSSISNPKLIDDVQKIFSSLDNETFKKVIAALYIHTFALKSESHEIEKQSNTPLSDTLTELLTHYPVSEALRFIPQTLTDVLTRHPVDPNRSFVTRLISELETEHDKWKERKTQFEKLIETDDYKAKQSATEELEALYQDIQNKFIILYSGESYRPKKINSFGEQQNSSRIIHDNEEKIRQANHRATRLTKLKFFEAIVKELQTSNLSLEEKNEIDRIMSLPQATSRLKELESCTILDKHPETSKIKQLNLMLIFQNWRADFDGNSSVSGDTALQATIDGLRRAFHAITEDEGLLQISDHLIPSKSLEIMNKRLGKVARQNYPEWTAFISEKIEEKWPIGKIYSALTLRRIQEAVQAAQTYLNSPTPLPQLLKKGFANTEQFLKIIEPLKDAEIGAGLQNGFWTRQYELAQIRGISSGGTLHMRKGENYNEQLLSETLHILQPHRYPAAEHLQNTSISQKKQLLKEFVETAHELPLGFQKRLSVASHRLFKDYTDITAVFPESVLVQSDSASHGDPELSMLVLESVSKLIEHKGKLTLLCEDHSSMISTISFLHEVRLEDEKFSRFIFQCAGSDNQRKLLPLLSAAANFEFISLVNKKGGTSFYGQGDTAWRSEKQNLPASMTTNQPGKQKDNLKGNKSIPYVLKRFATHINHLLSTKKFEHPHKAGYMTILETIGNAALAAYESQIEETSFTKLLQDNTGIQNTAFSREPKKPGANIRAAIRAIDSASAQQRENNFDGQLTGLKSGVLAGISELLEKGYTKEEIHEFFNEHPVGKSCLETLEFFYSRLDADLPTQYERVTSKQDIKEAYEALANHPIPEAEPDYLLRTARLAFQEAKRRQQTGDIDLRAQTLALLGHWPV